MLQARNKEQEQEILEWIEQVLGEKLPAGNYEDILKDGVILCQLINKIVPGSVKKIQTKGTNFQLMENVQRYAQKKKKLAAYFKLFRERDILLIPLLKTFHRFQAAIKKYGVPEEEIFQTADLFERRNVPQVTLCLYSLGRIVSRLRFITERAAMVSKIFF